MTEITPTRTLQRETATYHRGRALVVELHPGYCTVREKGKRTSYAIDWAAVYHAAAKLEAARQRAERMQSKAKGKRK